jgi:hypothetical protein
MTHLCAKLTPFCGNVTVGELDEVESILDITVKVAYCHMCILCLILELACKTAAEYWKRLSTNLFRKEEIFIKTETI